MKKKLSVCGVLRKLVLLAGLGAGAFMVEAESRATAWAAGSETGAAGLNLEGAPSGFESFAEPKVLAAISFQDEEGKTRTLSDFAGQVVLVNYWATWCSPCVREMPSLGLLQKRFLKSDFKVVAISLDGRQDPRVTVRAFYEEHEITSLAIYNDPTFASFRALVDESVALPYSVLIGRDGRALGELYGPASWHGESVYGFIETLLARDQASGAGYGGESIRAPMYLFASERNFASGQNFASERNFASEQNPQGMEDGLEYLPLEPHEGGCFGDGLFPTV